jgi:hypothetical protein
MAPGIWDKIKSGFQKMKKVTEDVAPVLQTMWNVGKPFFASQGVPTGLIDTGFNILGGISSLGSSSTALPSGFSSSSPSSSASAGYPYGYGEQSSPSLQRGYQTEPIIQKPWQRGKAGAIQYRK